MDKVEYNGKAYVRYSARWCDASGFAVSEALQRTLNHVWEGKCRTEKMTADELADAGDRLRDSTSYSTAVKFYNMACEADFTVERVAGLLPRIASCYISSRCPERAIELFSDTSRRLGRQIMTAELLTVAAEAYCELGEYGKALKCCNRAYAKLGGCATDELSAVYRRIDVED